MACDDEIIPSQERIENVADDADLEEVYDSERHLDRPKRRIASGSVFSSSLLHPKNRRSRGIVGKKIPLTFTKDGDDAHRAISKLKLIARRQDGRLYQGAPAARYRIFPRQVKS
jgi:hypothetical protein